MVEGKTNSLLRVFDVPLFGFRNSVEKLCDSWALPFNKHVGMRLAYFACPYPYVFVKRECPRDAKLFYGITENKKSANEHLIQTNF